MPERRELEPILAALERVVRGRQVIAPPGAWLATPFAGRQSASQGIGRAFVA